MDNATRRATCRAPCRATQDSWPWVGVASARETRHGVARGLPAVGDTLHLPFDVMRSQHAQAVQAGLLARSLLGSRDFERAVDALEHITLGPYARRV